MADLRLMQSDLPARLERLRRQTEREGWDPPENAPGAPPPPVTIDEPCRSLLRANDSPDVDMPLSINPYRGCAHACLFCEARPDGTEARLFAKTHAAERLREELRRPGYRPRPINLGAATDVYQPAEHRLGITRALLEVLEEAHHPLAIVTRSAGIVRDLDLLAAMAARGQLLVLISLMTLDVALARQLEPQASAPAQRLAAIRALARAGVPVGVNLSPLVPLLNEPEIEPIIAAAARAGARTAHGTALRLSDTTAPRLRRWLQDHRPELAAQVLVQVQVDDSPDMTADPGTAAAAADRMHHRLEAAAALHGLALTPPALDLSSFRPPRAPLPRHAAHFEHRTGQGRLF